MTTDQGVDQPESMSWGWLKNELAEKVEAIATSLRSGVAASSPVPNLDWNVGRLGAHLVAIPQLLLRAQDNRVELPDPSNPATVNEFSDRTAADVGTTDPLELADLLPAAMDQLLARLGDDGEAMVKWYQHDLTARELGGVVLSELMAHHIDLV